MNQSDQSGANWDEEELLELALNRSGGAESSSASVSQDPALLAELAAMRGDLDRLRTALSDERVLAASPALESGRERLVARILDRTTREDPSWRGDVVLFSRFCRERLRSSMLLRLAAASLAVHLAATPAVLAYLAYRKPALEPGIKTGFEPRVESPYVDDPVEEPPVIRFLGPDEDLPVPDLDLELLQEFDD